jgi:hypothetical protein
MTNRTTLHQLIEELPESELVTAERLLAYLRNNEFEKTLARLGREPPLYNTDFYQWTQTQAAALRDKDFTALDLENLAEEIESLGRSDRRALMHQLERLLIHLLKWRFQSNERGRRGRGWLNSILQARHAIAKLIAESHSLHDYPEKQLAAAYRHARRSAASQTGLPLAAFPDICPWPLEQILDEDIPPEELEAAP